MEQISLHINDEVYTIWYSEKDTDKFYFSHYRKTEKDTFETIDNDPLPDWVRNNFINALKIIPIEKIEGLLESEYVFMPSEYTGSRI